MWRDLRAHVIATQAPRHARDGIGAVRTASAVCAHSLHPGEPTHRARMHAESACGARPPSRS
jgi:hypothetical protein